MKYQGKKIKALHKIAHQSNLKRSNKKEIVKIKIKTTFLEIRFIETNDKKVKNLNKLIVSTLYLTAHTL